MLVKGGLGALTGALANAARGFGAQVRTGAGVERLVQRDGRVAGVVLDGGEEIEARAVVSAVDPQRTLLQLLDPVVLDPDDAQRARNYRTTGMASKVNLALSALPRFTRRKEGDEALRGRIHVGPDVDELERAFDEAKYGGISRRPWLDVTIPTLADPSLAPAGRHVMSVYVQYTPYRAEGRRVAGASGRGRGGGALDGRGVRTRPARPGRRRPGADALAPRAEYGTTGGHPSHGEPSLDQLFVTRPFLGFARYRTPVPGLYLCSAGTHPGGGVTGGPGMNAAREILREVSS